MFVPPAPFAIIIIGFVTPIEVRLPNNLWSNMPSYCLQDNTGVVGLLVQWVNYVGKIGNVSSFALFAKRANNRIVR